MKISTTPMGQSFDAWLEEQGLLEDATEFAIKRVLSWQVGQFMGQHGISKTEMARRMHTSRAALDRLLDPHNESVTLKTLLNAAQAIGARLQLQLLPPELKANP